MRIRILGAIICAVVVSGCVLRADHPHNDVLLFGTTTKIGVDVEAPVQNAGIPEFTVGYKRKEGVWMPLKPNGLPTQMATSGLLANIRKAIFDAPTDEEKLALIDKAQEIEAVDSVIKKLNDCMTNLSAIDDDDKKSQLCMSLVLPADKYVSMANGVDASKGGAGLEIDTYSVFASFGGSGSLSFNSASGNLAQFFATGIAAQRLGANPQVGAALNAKAPEATAKQAAADVAKAEADQAQAQADEAKYASFVQQGVEEYSKSEAETELVLACAKPSSEKEKYSKYVQSILDDLDDEDSLKVEISDLLDADDDTFAGNLRLSDEIRAQFINKYADNCN